MGRSPCGDKASVMRGPWSREEDAVLRSFVQSFSNAGNWLTLPHKAVLYRLNRCGKSCRLRWLNYLRPSLRHGGFTEEENNLILSLYGEIGSKWSVIAARLLPGRTDNDVKNYWNTKLKKRHLLTTTGTAAPLPPAGDESMATADSPSVVDDQSPPPPALVNLDAALATVDDGGELTRESEQLYAELMGLIVEQQSTTTNSSPSTGREAMSSSSPSIGTASPAASSFAAGSSPWPVDDPMPLPESSGSSLVEFGGPFGAHAIGPPAGPDAFQDLLASSYGEVVSTQDLLYY